MREGGAREGGGGQVGVARVHVPGRGSMGCAPAGCARWGDGMPLGQKPPSITHVHLDRGGTVIS